MSRQAWHDYYTDHGGEDGRPEIEEEIDEDHVAWARERLHEVIDGSGCWFKTLPTLFEHTAASARLVALRAQAVPTHPGARPEQLGSVPRPPQLASGRRKVEESPLWSTGEAARLGGDYGRVAVGGASQGCCMALDASLTHPKMLGGVFASFGQVYARRNP